MPQSTPPVARDRYERTLKGYRHRLAVFPKCTLRSFCSEMHVNYNGMKKWLSSNGLSVGSLKSRAGGFHAEVREETGDRTFLPVIPSQPDKPASSPSDFLSGVTLTFPDGTVLAVRRCSPESLISLVTLYRKEAQPCSR